MSFAESLALPEWDELPRREEPARRLRAVERTLPARRPRMAYAIVAVAGAVAIAVAQMALSVLITQDSYRVADLQQQQRALALEAQSLQDEVAGLSSPQYLAANAAALGMVIDASPTYLRLSDAAIIGSGAAAGGSSAVDARGTAQVSNALLDGTPLVTDPNTAVQGEIHRGDAAPTPEKTEPAEQAPAEQAPEPEPEPVIPPPAEGLPSPTTR